MQGSSKHGASDLGESREVSEPSRKSGASASRTRTRAASPIRMLAILFLAGLFAAQGRAQVTFDRLLNARNEPQNWLTYSGDYFGRRLLCHGAGDLCDADKRRGLEL